MLVPILLALAALVLVPPATTGRAPGRAGLLIVASFPNLVCDLGLLALEDDEVVSLAPAGADPHDYQLTPNDVELLKKADIIVSTAHTPFEAEIRELWARGELRGALVEVPSIPGIRLAANPATGQPNYHMPIYDPGNYKAFLTYLAELMAELRPDRAGDYRERAEEAVRAVDSLLRAAPRLDMVAVADLPFAQYAVGWLGVEVRFLIVKEHG
ncbi:ABC transporter substrate-binding protein, partial [Candidatus Bathyarchaeota archaeon]